MFPAAPPKTSVRKSLVERRSVLPRRFGVSASFEPEAALHEFALDPASLLEHMVHKLFERAADRVILVRGASDRYQDGELGARVLGREADVHHGRLVTVGLVEVNGRFSIFFDDDNCDLAHGTLLVKEPLRLSRTIRVSNRN